MLDGRAITPRFFRILLFAGLVLRAGGLPLRGTDDFNVWKLWTHAGSKSVTTMYDAGGSGIVTLDELHALLGGGQTVTGL